MNLGQAFGEMQLRISNLEEGGAVDQPSNGRTEALEIRRLRAELDASRTSETKALLEVARCKGELAARETIISDMRLRLAQQSAEKAVDPKGYEAKLRGKDQQLAELQRRLDEANSLCGSLEREVASLRSRPPERIEVPVETECPVCTPLRAAVRAEFTSVLEQARILQSTKRDGISDRIRAALASVDRPAFSRDIGQMTGDPGERVATNMACMLVRGDVVRIGKTRPFRYWLASRPLPGGFQA